ncbi:MULTISPECIES: restriction endonuclease [Cylindrospermopsis]|uniref:Restriction endonuclease n=2 Tax=Cylindrospermopsis TaxID=77021 RepID=A0A7H0F3V7_9CYAN|nr:MULTISPECIES: restriction endonuclease [Cylindrospermopsis]QNP30723.1 restriction endonuclease [Cylindrospermopsis curvispora GIHE-G1]TPX28056.1 restriction endonuclease [Cylindrospermopsis raciborskii GIHE 2018]
MQNYARDINSLKSHATMWWPQNLRDKNATTSIIPRLLETQDDFISILQLSKNNPTQVFELAEAANFPANLFLKHLVVISDYGGELMKRLGESFTTIFTKRDKTNKLVMDYVWKGKNHQYVFESMPIQSKLDNKKLNIDGKGLQFEEPFDGLKRDITMILLYASTSDVSHCAALDLCTLGSILGDKVALEHHIKQKYILVSRITGGANANSLGQLAQSYILKYLKEKLGTEFYISSNERIPLQGTEISFDIVVTKADKKVGIEISFQVTTNSTIERKAAQASERQALMTKASYKTAYVIDGAGNFERFAAISKICQHSDCTVAFSDSEFNILVDFLRENL